MKTRHEIVDDLKKRIKGGEDFYLLNDTNKSIAQFRETFPLHWDIFWVKRNSSTMLFLCK
jgi:hypothetical protein